MFIFFLQYILVFFRIFYSIQILALLFSHFLFLETEEAPLILSKENSDLTKLERNY